MSTCAAWDTLQIARDARLCGRMAECEALLAEVAPDFEIGRCTARRACPKFILDEFADEYPDAIDMRIRSYANFVHPVAYGVFPIKDEP